MRVLEQDVLMNQNVRDGKPKRIDQLSDADVRNALAEFRPEIQRRIWQDIAEAEHGLGMALRGLNDACAWFGQLAEVTMTEAGYGNPIDRAIRDLWRVADQAQMSLKDGPTRKTHRLMRMLAAISKESSGS